MLGTEGSYLFNCEISGIKDFIQSEDTFFFRISEFVGGILPEFEMTFTTNNRKITSYLHEGTLIKAQLGRTRKTLNDLTLYCTAWSSSEYGENYWAYNIKGFAVPLDYVRSGVLASYANMSAVEAVLACAKKSFKTVQSNITKSNDSQNWYQPNITNKNFIFKTLYRADLASSFPAIAITLDGKFILKDVLKDLSDKKVNWTFVPSKQKENDETEISYIADANISSNTGIVNAIIGYDFDFASMVIETEAIVAEVIKRKPTPLSNAGKVGGSTTANKKKIVGIQQTENVHNNFQKSYNFNLTSLLNMSRVEIPFTIGGRYHDIRPLDKAKFFSSGYTKFNKVEGKTINFSDDPTSGAYFVTNVVRQIENKKFTTNVKLSRESVNEVR